MTMRFRTVKAAIEALLVANAAGRYRVLGYQEPDYNEKEALDTDRFVEVFFQRGDLKPSSNGRGPFALNCTYQIKMTAAKAAECDLATLEDPLATPAQRAAVLTALEPATKAADDSLDELFDHIFQILMAGENLSFGLDTPKIASRWLSGFEKGDPFPRGEYVAIAGKSDLTCRVEELVPTAAKTASQSIDVTLQNYGDDGVTRAGVEEDN